MEVKFGASKLLGTLEKHISSFSNTRASWKSTEAFWAYLVVLLKFSESLMRVHAAIFTILTVLFVLAGNI